MSKPSGSSNHKLPHLVPSMSSISGSGSPVSSLTAMLHVTQVQTSEDNDAFYYHGDENGKTDLDQKDEPGPDLEEKVPKESPYVALISNLPMECSERELLSVFENFSTRSLILPKKGKRPKRFAYLEMNSREELIRLLTLGKLKCRGRWLSINLCEDLEGYLKENKFKGRGGVGLGGGGGDAFWSPENSNSEADDFSTHYSASISDLSTTTFGSFPMSSRSSRSDSSFYGRNNPIKRKPSTTKELEARMHLRLQKLAEFENAESEKAQSSQPDNLDSFMSWSDALNEARNSEEI
ncbi:hypothetical protein KR009_006594 [Drosophila setifemur]|nr:hypothetical protein KR009_006594 [Drosophila setifemur]